MYKFIIIGLFALSSVLAINVTEYKDEFIDMAKKYVVEECMNEEYMKEKFAPYMGCIVEEVSQDMSTFNKEDKAEYLKFVCKHHEAVIGCADRAEPELKACIKPKYHELFDILYNIIKTAPKSICKRTTEEVEELVAKNMECFEGVFDTASACYKSAFAKEGQTPLEGLQKFFDCGCKVLNAAEDCIKKIDSAEFAESVHPLFEYIKKHYFEGVTTCEDNTV